MEKRVVTNTEIMRKLEKVLLAIGYTKDHLDFRYALLVMAAMKVGTTPGMLVHLTGYPRDFVNAAATRMQAAGLWNNIREETWDECFEANFLTFEAQVKLAAGTMTPSEWNMWKARLDSLSRRLYVGIHASPQKECNLSLQ